MVMEIERVLMVNSNKIPIFNIMMGVLSNCCSSDVMCRTDEQYYFLLSIKITQCALIKI